MRNRIDAGIRQIVTNKDLVSEYECREACIFANYNWSVWLTELDIYERATCVAHYRIHNAIESNINDAVSREQERLSKHGSRRR